MSKNQTVTVQYSTSCEFLEIAFLARAQGLIDQHDLGAELLGAGADLLRLARADEVLRIGARAGGEHDPDRNGAGRSGQRLEFSRIVRIHRMPDAHTDQQRPLTTPRAFKQWSERLADDTHSTMAGSVTSPSSPVGSRTLRAGTTVEMACL